MTLEDFLRYLSGINPVTILLIFLLPPVLTLLIGLFQKDESPGGPVRYLYSFLVYLVSIPGVFSCVLTAYSLFFLKQNLLQVNLIIYFGPIISMILTLGLVRRKISWDELPGVDRFFAFVILIAVSFTIALGLEKTRIWVLFGGSMVNLLIVAIICFLLLKFSLSSLFKKKGETFGGPNGNLKKVQKDLNRIKRKMKL